VNGSVRRHISLALTRANMLHLNGNFKLLIATLLAVNGLVWYITTI